MRHRISLTTAGLLLVLAAASPSFAEDPRLGGMKLLPGYAHQPLQGIDSIVGKVIRKDGLEIHYDIGRVPQPGGFALGGDFSDRPKLTPENQRRWYQEQTVNGQPMHVAHLKDDNLLVSFPKKGMNFTVKVKTPQQMAEALLMILTYPNPVEKGDAEGAAKVK